MFPLFPLLPLFLLITGYLVFNLITIRRDRQRIRTFLQRRGATNIRIQTKFRGYTQRHWVRRWLSVYDVSYLTAAGQLRHTTCQRYGDEDSLNWANGMSDLYDLLPTNKSHRHVSRTFPYINRQDRYALLPGKTRTK